MIRTITSRMSRAIRLFMFAVVILLLSTCSGTGKPSVEESHRLSSANIPTPQRIVAIGDLHGDVHAARLALQKAGAIDPEESWIGGELHVVQVGDILDRGDHELAIMELFSRLAEEAVRHNGAVTVLNGNHEIMNVQLDFRYVTEAGFSVFAHLADAVLLPAAIETLPSTHRGRAVAFRPGGPWAVRLASNPVIFKIRETVFVHGGLLPGQARLGIDTINREVKDWMLGWADQVPPVVVGRRSPVWLRDYSLDTTDEDCAQLRETLRLLGAKRMVVAHTVQDHINCACDSLVWRVDTGMSQAYGGPVEVLEIHGSRIRIIR